MTSSHQRKYVICPVVREHYAVLIKRSVSAPKGQFTAAGQNLIRPLVEPFEQKFKPKQPQQNPIKFAQSKSLGVYIRELAKKMASCIGALKRVRDYGPNTALQSMLNSPVQPHFRIINVALPGTVAVQS